VNLPSTATSSRHLELCTDTCVWSIQILGMPPSVVLPILLSCNTTISSGNLCLYLILSTHARITPALLHPIVSHIYKHDFNGRNASKTRLLIGKPLVGGQEASVGRWDDGRRHPQPPEHEIRQIDPSMVDLKEGKQQIGHVPQAEWGKQPKRTTTVACTCQEEDTHR